MREETSEMNPTFSLDFGLEAFLDQRTEECLHVSAKSLQSCPTLHDPTDCRLPGSSVHGTLQARILECVVLLQGTVLNQGSNPCLLCLLGFFMTSVTWEGTGSNHNTAVSLWAEKRKIEELREVEVAGIFRETSRKITQERIRDCFYSVAEYSAINNARKGRDRKL